MVFEQKLEIQTSSICNHLHHEEVQLAPPAMETKPKAKRNLVGKNLVPSLLEINITPWKLSKLQSSVQYQIPIIMKIKS